MTHSESIPASQLQSGPFAALEKLTQPGDFVTLFITRTDSGLSVVLHGALGDTQPLLERGAVFDEKLKAVLEQLAERAPLPAVTLLEQVRSAPGAAPPATTTSQAAPKVSAPPTPPAAVQEVLSTPRHTAVAANANPAQTRLDLDDLDL